jgi:hypothetical protein
LAAHATPPRDTAAHSCSYSFSKASTPASPRAACLELSVRNARSAKRAAATQQRRTPQRRRVPGHAVRRAQNL